MFPAPPRKIIRKAVNGHGKELCVLVKADATSCQRRSEGYIYLPLDVSQQVSFSVFVPFVASPRPRALFCFGKLIAGVVRKSGSNDYPLRAHSEAGLHSVLKLLTSVILRRGGGGGGGESFLEVRIAHSADPRSRHLRVLCTK